MTSRYSIEVYYDTDPPTYVVFREDAELDDDDEDDEENASGTVVGEFNTREEAEALIVWFEQGDQAKPV